tara:strand:+ start:300 stop:698 length:399 start_codon:yes stop_codon:yes gene_type:complete
MIPELTERDRSAIDTTVKQSGLVSVQTSESNPASQEAPNSGASTSDASSKPTAPDTKSKNPLPTHTTAPRHDKKPLRVSVAPTSELADAIHAKIQTLSPDAQRFVTTATLLREFLHEHDARLAKLFREKKDI